MNKKAQEEMIGFALILIIIAVLILVFLSFALRNKTEISESHELNSFVQASLSKTTTCESNYEGNFQNIRRLIFKCADGETCLGGTNSCEILNETLQTILDDSWKVGIDYPEKGYTLNITKEGVELISYFS